MHYQEKLELVLLVQAFLVFIMMKSNFFKLQNPIQNYEWGSKTDIQKLFGIKNPNQEPQAEIWMGAHPNGCSIVEVGGSKVLLSTLVASDKSLILSEPTAEKFGELPYLFKVLSAANALSIQVHPSKSEAEVGFAKEEALGIALSAPNRNYRDANHKPELVYALTPYQAMNGFRSANEILSMFSRILREVDMPEVNRLVEEYRKDTTPEGLKALFVGILSLEGEEKQRSIQTLVDHAGERQQPAVEDDINSLIVELSHSYPDDVGLFAPLLLNVLTLKPGDAMYLDARTPHAYLKGTGLEIMANSDNVLRAGLTPKHIDIEELSRCTLFEEKHYSSLLCNPIIEGNRLSYPIPVPDFNFDCFIEAASESVEVNSAEIVFAIDSDVTISHDSGETLTINKGESVFIPAYAKAYSLNSSGRVARAYN